MLRGYSYICKIEYGYNIFGDEDEIINFREFFTNQRELCTSVQKCSKLMSANRDVTEGWLNIETTTIR